MRVVKIAEKVFIGKDAMIVGIFRKDDAKVYNMIYRDGKQGRIFAKRFTVQGITREKVYDLTLGTPGTRVLWLSEHDSEEDASFKVRLHLKPALRLRNVHLDFDFAALAIKGRSSKGNLVTKNPVDRVVTFRG